MTANAASDGDPIRLLSEQMRTSILALAETSQEASVALLGLAAILACQPDGLRVDVERVAEVLDPSSPPLPADRLRFVEFVGSLAMWVNALGPEDTSR